MIVRIDDDALAEARALALYYLRQNPAAGKKFLDLLGRAFHDIGVSPMSYPFLESLRRNKRFRRIRLQGFPVYVVYEIINNEVLIVAVSHASRRPGYWRGRLGK